MRHANCLILLLLGLVTVPSAAAEKRFDVSGFDELRVKGAPDVRLIQGKTEGVLLTGDDDALADMLVYVEGDVLHIRPKQRRDPGYRNADVSEVQAEVNFKNLERVHAAGSGDIVTERLRGDELSVSIAGKSNIALNALELSDLNVNISGSATVNLSGVAAEQRVQINGSANYTALELLSEEADIGINGSGKVTVNTRDELKVSINGKGDVVYAGDPTVTHSIRGSGKVRRKNSY